MSEKSAPLSECDRFWLRHYNDWKQSGLSQQRYCQEHQLNRHAFNSARSRLRSRNLLPVTSAERARPEPGSLLQPVTLLAEPAVKVSRLGLDQQRWLEFSAPIPVAQAVALLRQYL